MASVELHKNYCDNVLSWNEIFLNFDLAAKSKELIKHNPIGFFVCHSAWRIDRLKPIMKDYNIPEKNIFADELIFDKDGYITSINKKNPLSKNLGKIEIAKKIKGEKIIIGDGYTDYEIKKYKFASKFIQHIENINRKNLNSKADLISNSLDESISYIIKEYE